MGTESIRRVAQAGGLDGYLQTAETMGGTFHHSHQIQTVPVHYNPFLPAGLHLSCGIARLSTQGGLGGFDLAGPGLTAMLCPADAPAFSTRMMEGEAKSCGFFLPVDATAEIPHLGDIQAILRHGAPLRATNRPPPHLIAQLCAPIDPWFQDGARALVAQARVLELTALVWTWLSGKDERLQPSPRLATQADTARDMLEDRLRNPPSLAELARMVGTNVRTLTDAFRLRFNMSIATYVTKRRLEVAAHLLQEGMGVAQAAYHVGYTPSHFSNAFQRQFGMRPQAARHRR